MTPPAMSTPRQEGVSTLLKSYNEDNPILTLIYVIVGFVPDGSYVSVPSPLGKIKSMTKGSRGE